jgi:hypothetical protein
MEPDAGEEETDPGGSAFGPGAGADYEVGPAVQRSARVVNFPY